MTTRGRPVGPVPTVPEAEAFVARSTFVWHQSFDLVPGVPAPGPNPVAFLWEKAGLRTDLTGRTVLDVGTSNGGAAIECERRGASRVVAVDVVDPSVHGIVEILEFLGSRVEFVQGNVYTLPEIVDGTFDVVIFWGVLYHLRHPLLALDALRSVADGLLVVESAVDAGPAESGGGPQAPMARFFRGAELGGDPTNWFAPTVRTMCDWIASAGFEVSRVEAWPEPLPSRAMVAATACPGTPEYLRVSYEQPLRVEVVDGVDRVDRVGAPAPNPEAGATAPLAPPVDDPLPVPPREMRVLVGPTDVAAFDNPTHALVFPRLSPAQYASVVDFGCGCGRLARQLAMQHPRPDRYVGFDLHRGMVQWCSSNLAPRVPGFSFLHHDVFEPGFNPGDRPEWRPFPVGDHSATLLIATSVFTHIYPEHAEPYLAEVARVLTDDGVALTTWFFFDKRDFPMMQADQHALFVNRVHATNAVIVDRGWFGEAVAAAGLVAHEITAPEVRGFQWTVMLSPAAAGRGSARFPEDDAPVGLVRAGIGGPRPDLVRLTDRA